MQELKQAIKDKARQLGFFLAGVTIPEPPTHYETFEHWLAQGPDALRAQLHQDRTAALAVLGVPRTRATR